jgi:hypothetical protein
MQTDTKLPPFVPASMTGSQDHCSRQSVVAMQSTKQTQPLSSSAHDEPEGQLLEPPQDSVQTPPGNSTPDWQSPLSHSVPFTQEPPTKLLSLPAVPAGRPSSPQPAGRNRASATVQRTKEDFMAVVTIDQGHRWNQRPSSLLCNIHVTF